MANATDRDAAELALLQQMEQATCYPYTEGVRSVYKYYPSLAAGIIFCILFGIPFFYHTFQSIRLRAATSIVLAFGALTELIGWASRTYSAKCPYNHDAFLSQEVTLIIAPVFFSAALYVLLGQLILALGRGSSLLSARSYAAVFCTCDVASLIVQAIGGAKASGADTDAGLLLGTHIMVAGIAFQLFTMTLFGALVVDFLHRVGVVSLPYYGHGREGGAGGMQHGQGEEVTRGMRRVLAAMLVSFVMIYIRSVYRTVELAQGWNGYLITHEGYFIGLDAAIMVVAVAAFVPVDPAVIFRREGLGASVSGGRHPRGAGRRFGAAKSAGVSKSPDVSDAEVGLAMGDVPGTRY